MTPTTLKNSAKTVVPCYADTLIVCKLLSVNIQISHPYMRV